MKMDGDRRTEAYQREAAQLRGHAAKEPEGSILREQLLDLADEYERLADQVNKDWRSRQA